MTNGDAATHALAEAFGKVVEEAVGRAIKPLESEIREIHTEIREIHEMFQTPEASARSSAFHQKTS